MSGASIPSGFLKNFLNNGVGRYVCQLQRVTFKFCKQRNDSIGTRNFIEKNLLDFANANPGVVVYLKPRNNRSPNMTAEYLNGRTEIISTAKLTEEEVCQWLEHLRGRSGEQIIRLRKNQHTETPSTQGVWHPFTNRNTALNVTTLPNKELSEAPKVKSATDRLLDTAKKLREGDVSFKQ